MALTLSMRQYIRTCQACGHKQPGNDPNKLKGGATDNWRDTKCRVCKSEALDWGSYQCDCPDPDDCEEYGCFYLRKERA